MYYLIMSVKIPLLFKKKTVLGSHLGPFPVASFPTTRLTNFGRRKNGNREESKVNEEKRRKEIATFQRIMMKLLHVKVQLY